MRFFGRKRRQSPGQERSPAPETPFGEDITDPDSRTMPPEFHGTWARDYGDCDAAESGTRTVIETDRIVVGATVQRVVAVRFIEAGQVAVVTLPAEEDRKEYGLYYFGLADGGASLVDLENMDWVLRRCPERAG